MYKHILEGEVAVAYIPAFREYGIRIIDGGTSMRIITYCPWCGKMLPGSLRDEWFDTLRGMGYENPLEMNIPTQYRTDKWWKNNHIETTKSADRNCLQSTDRVLILSLSMNFE